MIEIDLKFRGTTASTGAWSDTYILKATEAHSEITELEAMAAVAAYAPTSISDNEGNSLYAADVQLEDFIPASGLTIAFVTVPYAPPESGSPLGSPESPAAVYEFSYQAPSEHIYYALATTSYGTSPPDIKNKVFVNADGEHLGLDLPGGNTTNVWRLTGPKGAVSSTYEALVEGMMGSVNSAPFQGRPAGSMRFVQCTSSVTRGGSVALTWGFQYSANQTGLTIGGISGVSKKGHNVLWQKDEWKVDNNALVLVPRAVYVQQVFPEADLNQLGFTVA